MAKRRVSVPAWLRHRAGPREASRRMKVMPRSRSAFGASSAPRPRLWATGLRGMRIQFARSCLPVRIQDGGQATDQRRRGGRSSSRRDSAPSRCSPSVSDNFTSMSNHDSTGRPAVCARQRTPTAALTQSGPAGSPMSVRFVSGMARARRRPSARTLDLQSHGRLVNVHVSRGAQFRAPCSEGTLGRV